MLKNKLSTMAFIILLILVFSAPALAASTYLIDKQGNQKFPVIAGDIMVYEDHHGGTPGIFIYDFATKGSKRISGTVNSQYAPHTDGKYVVWIDSSFNVQSIYLYNLATGEKSKLTAIGSEKRSPKVQYPWVVWSEYRDSSWNIYSYNIATKQTTRVAKHNYGFLRKEFDGDGNRRAHHDGQISVTLSNDRIVWTDFRNQKWDLYGADLKTGQEFAVVSEQRDQFSPDLEGDHLVYQDNRDYRSNIYFYDFKTGQSKLLSGAQRDKEFPKISGNIVVWQDFRNQRWDIYGYDLTAGKEIFINSVPNHQTHPSISGNRLVFMDNSKSREDISMVTMDNKPAVDIDSIPGIKIMINGRILPTDVAPVMENGRLLIPVRAVGEALGANVDWNADLQQIILIGKGNTVQLKIGNKFASINGVSAELDVPAKILQGRTLVPLRFVSQALGANVNWDGNKQLVEISF